MSILIRSNEHPPGGSLLTSNIAINNGNKKCTQYLPGTSILNNQHHCFRICFLRRY